MMSNMKKLRILCLTVVLLGVFVVGASAAEVRYTKVNIHAQQKDGKTAMASYANYTNPGEGHIVIPVGTEIRIIKKSKKRFDFTYNETGQVVRFEFHAQRMAMSVDEYLDKITSAAPYKPSGMSKLDMKGIKEGKALVGMSKAGVMAALGYPAAHKTPSPEANLWTYWTNRFVTTTVDFDDKGKAKAVK